MESGKLKAEMDPTPVMKTRINRKTTGAFTLVEVLFVMAIVVLLFAAAASGAKKGLGLSGAEGQRYPPGA